MQKNCREKNNKNNKNKSICNCEEYADKANKNMGVVSDIYLISVDESMMELVPVLGDAASCSIM